MSDHDYIVSEVTSGPYAGLWTVAQREGGQVLTQGAEPFYAPHTRAALDAAADPKSVGATWGKESKAVAPKVGPVIASGESSTKSTEV